jgi:acetylornithine/N-succinyldiaminopimelate aminotransferase
MHVADRPPVIFVEGKGSWLYDREGRPYLDFVQGWAVNCLGHCHPV